MMAPPVPDGAGQVPWKGNTVILTHNPRRCEALLCAIENVRDAGNAATTTLAELDAEATSYYADGLLSAGSCPCIYVHTDGFGVRHYRAANTDLVVATR